MGIAKQELTVDRLEAFRRRVARAEQQEVVPSKAKPPPPADAAALRGIPVLGVLGVGGVIRGTRPGDSAWRLEKDDRYLRRPRVKRV